MIWIDQGFYMENGLNWLRFLHGKWSELIRIFTWKMVWIDQDFYIQMVWIDQGCYMKMVWIDYVFYIINGLNWSGLLHGKWSELIKTIAWQMAWIDQGFYMANGLNWLRILHGKHPTSEQKFCIRPVR